MSRITALVLTLAISFFSIVSFAHEEISISKSSTGQTITTVAPEPVIKIVERERHQASHQRVQEVGTQVKALGEAQVIGEAQELAQELQHNLVGVSTEILGDDLENGVEEDLSTGMILQKPTIGEIVESTEDVDKDFSFHGRRK